MGKTWHDRPAKKHENAIKKSERGSHRKMDPYVKARRSSWKQEF